MFKEFLCEMSNIFPDKTGLKYTVYVSVKQGSHDPRIKIFKGKKPQGDNFSVTIEDEPKTIGTVFVNSKELNKIYNWVKLNKKVLLKHWNFEIDSLEMLSQLKRI